MSFAIAELCQNKFGSVQETSGKDDIPWHLATRRLVEAGVLTPLSDWPSMLRMPFWFQNLYR